MRAELPTSQTHFRQVHSQEARALIDNAYGLMTSGSGRVGRLPEMDVKLQLDGQSFVLNASNNEIILTLIMHKA